MKKSCYSDSQIINILKQAEDGSKVSDLCRQHGMSNATFYKWRTKFKVSFLPIWYVATHQIGNIVSFIKYIKARHCSPRFNTCNNA